MGGWARLGGREALRGLGEGRHSEFFWGGADRGGEGGTFETFETALYSMYMKI